MFDLSPDLEAWHDAISELTSHAKGCDGCDLDGATRCAEGQQLYDDEQTAWLARRRASWCGRVIA